MVAKIARSIVENGRTESGRVRSALVGGIVIGCALVGGVIARNALIGGPIIGSALTRSTTLQ